ncbi:MAG: MBL fold metallo-hydrolase [Bacteroidales bacterium]|jgi:phosphoribosyl 1,2-cyclic phosphodiesterase|nr:MBL fold metallo-hydrolase [Bacteroidales bacterium]
MIEICAIASGSNGNCYYIGNEESAVLIDAGISCLRIMERMKQKNLNPEKIKAVFISHEHTDHIKGARVFCKKNGIRAYMTERTWQGSGISDRPGDVVFFDPGDTIEIDAFTVYTFLKKHDAAEPCSFRINYQHINVGVFTDIGEACENVSCHFRQCQALFLESNYDEDKLWTGRYPYYLKKRIASSHGHLSNLQALELLRAHHHPDLQMVLLSHLSEENNAPELALSTFQPFKEHFSIIATDRYASGKVYRIVGS